MSYSYAGHTDAVQRGRYDVEDTFYTDCDPPVRVYVDGVEIPVINQGVEVQSRSDGPMDVNKISNIHFPVEWEGEDIGEDISAYAPSGSDSNVWQPVDIDIKDPKTGNYVTYHRGFSMAYGAGSKGTIERTLRVGDPGMLLKNTPFSKTYNRGASVGDVLTDIIDVFNNHQDVFNVTDVAHIEKNVINTVEQSVDNIQDSLPGGGGGGPLDAFIEGFTEIPLTNMQVIADIFTGSGEKHFKKNRHTLQDAMAFVTKKIDGDLYFSPIGDSAGDVALVYDEHRNVEHTAENLGGNGPRVIQNNALYEIQPINSVEVSGSTSKGILDDLADIIDQDGNEYPMAVARHNRLYNLAGSEYKPPIIEDSAATVSEAEDIAREELINRVEGGGMGEIILYQYPHIDSHDLITSKPACGHNVDQDVEPITYSVEEVTHRIGYEDDRFLKRTHLRVNTHVTNDDIEIVESGTETL